MIITKEKIEQEIAKAFLNCGCTQEEANINAKIFVQIEMCGVATHGLRMVPAHIAKYIDGVYRYGHPINIEVEKNSFAKVNAEGMCGLFSAWQCMEYAIRKAEQCGVYTVFANHCNTYGAAFVYPLMAAERGLIGLTFCNTPAQMALMGGAKKMLGTNPIAYAIPVKGERPILFDASTSIVAKSKINVAAEKGEEIPVGWALDEYGLPTADAKAAQKGSILPMAGPKGYGLSLLFDILAGFISGASYLNNVGRFYGSNECMNVGQVFVAMNPALIYGDNFAETMRDYVNEIRSSSQHSEVHLPGDRKWMAYDKAMNEGVEITEDLYNKVVQYGKKFINEQTHNAYNSALRARGGVFSLEPLSSNQLEKIREKGWRVTVLPRDINELESCEQKDNIEVVIARDRDDIEGLCKICKNLKFLYIVSTGVEKLPFDTLKEKGVIVVNAGGIGSGIMSEHVMGYILAQSTNVCENYQNQLTRTWKKFQCVESLSGKTLLIIGAGGTGKKIAEKASVFGMRCVGIKKHVQPLPNFERVVGLDKINDELPQADYVVCTIPLTPDTEYLFNKQRFEKMKKGAMFINISRGKLVVESDLVNALRRGQIGQAVLDVFENEPLEKDSILWNVENLWISPHQAGRLSDFMDKAIDVFVRNYEVYLAGDKVPNQINVDYGY